MAVHIMLTVQICFYAPFTLDEFCILPSPAYAVKLHWG